MRAVWFFLLSVFFTANFAAVVAADGEDFRIVLAPGSAPQIQSAAATFRLVREVPGESLEWDISSKSTHLLGLVESNDYFDVERPRQVLAEIYDHFPPQCRPEQGWPAGVEPRHFFSPSYDSTVREAGECGYVANVTGTGPSSRQLIAFPLNATKGNATLRLTRDVDAPGYSLGQIQNLTHTSFYFETTTTEWAFASLDIREATGGEIVQNPTPVLSRLQRFPVQGLDAETDYVFHLEFWDWSENRVLSAEMPVRTLVEPVRPKPEIISVMPLRNSTVEKVSEITVSFTNPAGTVSGVSVFLDKTPVAADGVQIGADTIVYTPSPPLEPGRHVVGVEIMNSEGGKAVVQWSFEVQPAKTTPLGDPFVVLFAFVGLWALRRDRARNA